MTGKAAINREAANHHLREYEAFCCWTFPFPDLTVHPRRQIRIEMATIQTNNTNRVLMTTTTNHVTSRPKIVLVSLAEMKKGTCECWWGKLVNRAWCLLWHKDSSEPSAQWSMPSQTKSVAMQNSLRLHLNSVQACSETKNSDNVSNRWQMASLMLKVQFM